MEEQKSQEQTVENNNSEFQKEDIEKNKVMAALAYLIFFLPLVACKDSKFGRYHANQGLILLLASIAGSIVLSLITGLLPWTMWRLVGTINTIWGLAVTAFAIIGIVNAVNGKAKELPYIGQFKLIK